MKPLDEFDFQNKGVQLLSYEIQSVDGDFTVSYYRHPRSWKIEGTNDKSNDKWDLLDSRTDCTELKSANGHQYFVCQHQNQKYYRYIRYFQTAEWKNKTEIEISRFEMYGNVL